MRQHEGHLSCEEVSRYERNTSDHQRILGCCWGVSGLGRGRARGRRGPLGYVGAVASDGGHGVGQVEQDSRALGGRQRGVPLQELPDLSGTVRESCAEFGGGVDGGVALQGGLLAVERLHVTDGHLQNVCFLQFVVS